MYDTGIAFVLGRIDRGARGQQRIARERLVVRPAHLPHRARRRAGLLPRDRRSRCQRPGPIGLSPSGAPCCRCSRTATSRSTARRARPTRTSRRCPATSRSGWWARYSSSWPTRVEEGRTAELAELTEPLSEFVAAQRARRTAPMTPRPRRACRRRPRAGRSLRSRTSTSSCARRSAASSPTELRPHVGEWEDAEWFPNEVFTRMAELGYLGLKYPEQYGGQGGDYVHDAVLAEELTGAGSGGLSAGHRRAHRHRHAADLEVRHRGPEAALPRAGDPRRADRRARDHRAGRRVRRGRHPHVRAQGRRRLRRQRLEDVHHERGARRLRRHRREDDRGRRPPGAVVPAASRRGWRATRSRRSSRSSAGARPTPPSWRSTTCSSPTRTCSGRRTRAST